MENLEIVGVVIALIGVPASVIALVSYRRTRTSIAFDQAYRHLRRKQTELRRRAFAALPVRWRLPDIELLGKPDWILPDPIPLERIRLSWLPAPSIGIPDPPTVSVNDRRLRYSEALQSYSENAGLFNGVVYSLRAVQTGEDTLHLGFTKGWYFDYLDSSEFLAHEAAARSLAGRPVTSGRYRGSIKDPFDLRYRSTSLGINTLTIRMPTSGVPGFFIHKRGQTNMANETNVLHVVPAGEFAPSDYSAEAVTHDFDLARNIVREYAEEFLNVPEAFGTGGATIDFDTAYPFSELTAALRAGKLRLFALGIALDALCYKPELLTVAVFDAEIFDTLFTDLTLGNAEGVIISGKENQGIPFTADSVQRYAADADASPAGSACLTLAWRARHALGTVHAGY